MFNLETAIVIVVAGFVCGGIVFFALIAINIVVEIMKEKEPQLPTFAETCYFSVPALSGILAVFFVSFAARALGYTVSGNFASLYAMGNGTTILTMISLWFMTKGIKGLIDQITKR